jgi:ATP-dependent RNA helicase DDX10/DBP4
VFDVLRVVGERHGFSAGLVIGGKDFEEEAEKIAQMNILITTPGRLLQHMQETPYFNADNLKILVIDEVDRIMDLGFA